MRLPKDLCLAPLCFCMPRGSVTSKFVLIVLHVAGVPVSSVRYDFGEQAWNRAMTSLISRDEAQEGVFGGAV